MAYLLAKLHKIDPDIIIVSYAPTVCSSCACHYGIIEAHLRIRLR